MTRDRVNDHAMRPKIYKIQNKCAKKNPVKKKTWVQDLLDYVRDIGFNPTFRLHRPTRLPSPPSN